MLVLLGIIGILLLVIAHEAGHFWAARRNGIEVEEFGIGFPPKAKTLTKKNGTEYTLNWLPLGGFVKLKGEHDSDTTPGSFGAASLSAKVQVMLAGVVVNFLLGWVLLTIVALIGMPQLVPNQYGLSSDRTIVTQDVLAAVAPESPADTAGIQDNDVIRRVEQTSCDDTCIILEVNRSEDLIGQTEQLAGQDVIVTHERDGQVLQTAITLNTQEFVDNNAAEVDACLADDSINNDDCPFYQSFLGVQARDYEVVRSTWSAPIVGAGTTVQFTDLTLRALGSIVTGLARGDTEAATENVSGVVGVGFVFSDASFLGPVFTLMIIAVVSLSLAIMNTLPIPALDGGRFFVTMLYRVLNKPLSKDTEERIHSTGFMVLMVLFVLITIVDVNRFIL